MKKITLLAIVAVAATFGSCKKDYTCECTVTAGSVSTTSSATAKMKKSEAESWCSSQKGSAPGYTYECKLK